MWVISQFFYETKLMGLTTIDEGDIWKVCCFWEVCHDSILNILDIVSMITLILDGEYDECGDVNSDGDLNILDVVTFVNIILSIP